MISFNKIFKIPFYQLYLLQLENYELNRYWILLFRKGFGIKGSQRKNLEWTAKARSLFAMAAGFYIAIPVLIIWAAGGRNFVFAAAVALWLLLPVVFFLPISLALVALWPVDWLVKRFIVKRAQAKILSLKPALKVIGIAGSYGKTTMKQVLVSVLGAKLKVLGTPESINTPLGIAKWIMNDLDESIQVAVVEMGEHYPGDIKQLCRLAQPDIAVVTGINEAHLERMKDLSATESTVFEIVSEAGQQSLVLLNSDDPKIINRHKEFTRQDQKLVFYGRGAQETKIKDKEFNAESMGWRAEFEGVGQVFVRMLGEYSVAAAQAAAITARAMGMSGQEIKHGIEKIRPVEHRLQPIFGQGNVLVIDDAYNGNPDGAAEAVRVLSRFVGRRKVYITPGLVEIGKRSAEVHRQLGRQLAGTADVVVLIKNSVTPEIEIGIRQGEKEETRAVDIIWFNSAQEAHVALKDIIKPGDAVMFQNDWGDQYF